MNLIKRALKLFLHQQMINYFYHLPMAFLANLFWGFPSRNLKVVGVTGTDGKTTTVNMIYQILKTASKKVSMVSTINAPGPHVTSPDPFTVQKFLKQASISGDEYTVLEVTSHALDQFRFWGVKFDIGVITNITHEHLDYHKTFENYFNTKIRLIKDAKYGIVNQNTTHKLQRSLKVMWMDNVITFGILSGDFNQKNLHLKLKVPGDYNIENALAAMAVADVLGIKKSLAKSVLENFEGLTGRMEEVKNNEGIKIVIDFAHTPNGLESALKTLHSPTRGGRLITLFGAEGFRDEGKRAMMGEIAQRLSDIVIVTSVDPRGQMETINRQIAAGARQVGAVPGKNFFIIEDRGEAINFAINNLAKSGDTVALFGKGHERSMNMDGRKEIPWSDREAVERVLYGSKV